MAVDIMARETRSMAVCTSKNDLPAVDTGLSLMSLPAEVRHQIYRELFCWQQQPLLLSRQRQCPSTFGGTEPTFCTALFRASRQLYQDAVSYAYGNNAFLIRQDFDILKGFGQLVRRSIRYMTIYPTLWGEESQGEIEVWDQMVDFIALEEVKIWIHLERLFPAIPYLDDLRTHCALQALFPSVALDLRVWEGHLSFEMDRVDHDRSRRLIEEGADSQSVAPPPRLHPRQQIMRLPVHAKRVVIVSDISAASARALDQYLTASGVPLLNKAIISFTGQEHIGRSQRLWYQLELSEPVTGTGET